MKKSLLFLSLVGIIAGVQNANATISASADNNTAKVNLLKKLTITKGSDLNFGDIAYSSTAGNVTIGSNGTMGTPSNLTLVTNANNSPSAGTLSITGPASNAITVTLPSTSVAAGTGVTITDFTSSDLTNGKITMDTNGTATLHVGGKLNVATNATDGAHSGTYTVSVSY